jgi:hypothetical protein
MGYPWPSPLHRVHHRMVEVACMWSDSSSMLVSIEVGVSMNQLIDWFDTNISFKCLELVSSKSFGTKQPQTYRGGQVLCWMDERYDRLFPLSLHCPIVIDVGAQNDTSSLKLPIFNIRTCLPQDVRGNNFPYGSGGKFGQHKVIERLR